MLGQANVVYWFLIFALPTPIKGLELPRYTKTDEQRLVETAKDMVVKPGVTFGDVYQNRTMSYMTPLPDGSFERWHYKRIVCVGDSAHKVRTVHA
jgi:2-polyprenyl-6-methoxyphenol hydroxylase-like FAD-dependent oxidoreductase